MKEISLNAQRIFDIATGGESTQESLIEVRELQPWQWLDEDQLKQVASLKVFFDKEVNAKIIDEFNKQGAVPMLAFHSSF